MKISSIIIVGLFQSVGGNEGIYFCQILHPDQPITRSPNLDKPEPKRSWTANYAN